MLIHNVLENSAQKYPEKEAVYYNNKWIGYGEIEIHSNKLANFLIESGVKRGDRVGILYENSFEYIISYYAILKCGGVVVALNTDTTTDLLIHLLNHAEPVAVISSRKYFRFLLPALKFSLSVKNLIVDSPVPEKFQIDASWESTLLKEIFDAGISKKPRIHIIDIDLSAIIYTSGSTGDPKGVMLSHLNTVANTKSIVEYLRLTNHDRIMVILPFFYVYGKTLLNTHFMVGGSVVLDNRFTYPNVVLETMKEQRTTGFAGVPSTYMILLHKSILRTRSFPELRYITQAGGGMAPTVQKEVIKAFSPAKLYIMYGATELAPRLTWLPPEYHSEKIGSIGIPVPNTEAFIIDQEGNRIKNIDEVGEIVGRGSNVMQGYWRDTEGTAKVLQEGIYHTGDMGRMDKDGFLYVVGRSKDILKIGGNRASAKEIEDALLELPDVLEIAVIGVEDKILGEAAKAFIVVNEDCKIDENNIRKFLVSKLAQYKIPKFFQFTKSLPKNKSGKILKNKLINEERMSSSESKIDKLVEICSK